ncbi:MAG TPA: c-type cytochrome domain-containing protein [Verrucomicrobiae bacterium]|jgi:hypothetical protein
MKRTIVYLLALATLPVAAQEKVNKWDITKVDVSKLPPAASDKGVTYDKDIEPILKASCVGCHGEQKPRANLRLDSKDAILKGGKDGSMVVSGESSKSLLVAAAAQIDDKIAMPPKHRGRGPGGPGGPGGPPPGAPPPDGGQNAGGPPPGGGGPGGPGGHPPPKPLTPEQVGLLRAWIDQGAN